MEYTAGKLIILALVAGLMVMGAYTVMTAVHEAVGVFTSAGGTSPVYLALEITDVGRNGFA